MRKNPLFYKLFLRKENARFCKPYRESEILKCGMSNKMRIRKTKKQKLSIEKNIRKDLF